jgi:predicted ribosome-associated RNA-binding protein Tma20
VYAVRGKRVNIFTVDWSEYSYSADFYYVTQEIVPKVAEYLYPMVQTVMEKQRNNRVHMVGFDMGAHMAGITGKHVHGPKIARITGTLKRIVMIFRYYNNGCITR